jgi:2-hydroxy-3-keto-5-methylthiopentenyl-1-phosphate phosphatase
MTITSSSTTNLPESLGETLTTDVSLDGGITGSFEVTKNESGTVIVLTLNGGTSPIYVQFAVTSIDTL